VRILLTGTTGQVGGALCGPLADLGEVIAVNRTQLDLSRPETIAGSLDLIKPDLVVNPAAYTAVDRAEDEKSLAFRVNAEAPGALAVWTARHNVPLVHFSTDYVFDGSGERPWREHDLPAPLSVYGESKLAGEAAIRDAGGAHLIVRTSWVYSNNSSNFMLTIAKLAADRTELRIVADQFGAPTSARLIADAVMKILVPKEADLADQLSHARDIINIASAGETSWHGFATAIVGGLVERGIDVKTERVLPITTEDYPTRATRPRNSRLDLGRLAEVCGVTTISWQQALEIELDEFVAYRRMSIAPEQTFENAKVVRRTSDVEALTPRNCARAVDGLECEVRSE
jgi:dTDP-4-dehydrorhamnose reductase